MKKQIIFMIVCLSVAILFGCQPTPEGPGPVAGHTSQADPGADALVWKDVPATCTTTAALPDGIKLVIDADVMVPEVPLCKGSIQRIPFDMTRLNRWRMCCLEIPPSMNMLKPNRSSWNISPR